jgi:hypothetical protein
LAQTPLEKSNPSVFEGGGPDGLIGCALVSMMDQTTFGHLTELKAAGCKVVLE